ncbi:uncharacterized protein LOC123272659 [Cotesia glomerata]|uniref:uncharacterized protein LOC123272659 n=1 Tax=Cotesia glomerata TaxID=32391 RepID=UPI001D0256AF|nr:uncharacterized protein LOC123272659 [Cotesia glomerata]
MRISIQEICAFALATPRSKCFTGGENILNQGHLLYCGKISEISEENNCLKIIAFCLQTSNIRDDPHEINGEVLKDKGKIVGMSCSCAAGLGGECKHVVATLLYLNRNDLESLKVISCTDKKCAWSAPKQFALQQYDMKPYDEYEEFRRILIEDNPLSALAMHMHDPVQAETNKVIISPDKMTAIIKNQQMSKLLLKLKNFDIKFTTGECCRKTLSRLSDDTRKICEDTHEFYSVWIKEKQLRITASDAYKLFTYRKNKNPDWKKKSVDYFFGESFSNASTKYGLENESIAREAYDAKMSVEVVHCGLIISKEKKQVLRI